jgi:hypothetical protein
MSFLLDALGKADHDRRQAEVPELRTYNQARRSPLGRALRVFGLVGLLMSCFALGYILRPYLEAINFDHAEPSTSNVSAPKLEKPASEDVTAQPSQTAVVNNVPLQAASKAYELEVISYSEYPAARFVMINGAMVHEGEILGSGEVLLLIEPDGVVLEKAGKQIRVRM